MGTNTVNCEICKMEMIKASWKRHIQPKKHKQREEQKYQRRWRYIEN